MDLDRSALGDDLGGRGRRRRALHRVRRDPDPFVTPAETRRRRRRRRDERSSSTPTAGRAAIPGRPGYGAVVFAPDGTVLAERAASLGIATNNVAEYSGLIAGLEAALATSARPG